MGQYITPPLEQFLKTRLNIMPSQRLAFFNRMDNLCELSGVKMSDELRSEVEAYFGFAMVRVIEGFADFDAPRLQESLYSGINRMIPAELRLEFIRLFARVCESCSVICLTVADSGDLPIPPEGCEFALVAVPNAAYGLVEWNGVAWDTVAGIGTADFIDVTITTIGDYTVTINGVSGLTQADSPYTIPTPTGYVDATFVDGGCEWEMERLEPSCSPYTLEWIAFDTFQGIGVYDGTLNGVDLMQSITTIQSQLSSIYETWEGHTGVQTAFLFTNDNYLYIALIRDSNSAAFTSFGEYINNNDPENPMQLTSVGNINCELLCQTASFSTIDAPNTEIDNISVGGNALTAIGAPAININSPTLAADITSTLRLPYGYGIIDPEWDFQCVVDGDDVTITVQSLYVYDWVYYNNVGSTIFGTAYFSACP